MSQTDKDSLGTRMKLYEELSGVNQRLMPYLPILIRLDGRAFHTFTSDLDRPYCEPLSELMAVITNLLVKETNACIGFTQSDEITLVLNGTTKDSQSYFDGRRQKIETTTAAFASVAFNTLLPNYLPEKALLPLEKKPTFDSRAWNVPTKEEATAAILWRERDASKNSVSMAARAYFSHNQLMNKQSNEMQEMLFKEKGINWSNYPSFFKRGTYMQRRKTERKFTMEEIENLPKKHQARTNPDLIIERSDVVRVNMPQFEKIVNKVDVVFLGAAPIVLSS